MSGLTVSAIVFSRTVEGLGDAVWVVDSRDMWFGEPNCTSSCDVTEHLLQVLVPVHNVHGPAMPLAVSGCDVTNG